MARKKKKNSIEDMLSEDLLRQEDDTADDASLTEAPSQYELQRQKFERAISSDNPWNRSELGLEAERAAMAMLSTKHGIYAQVPIICKGSDCPYAFQCELLKYDLAPKGERCPVETARMSQEYQGYAQEFDIDHGSQTDKVLLSEIISMDILLARCQTLMAKDATPVVDIVAGISDSGEPIMQPAVSKAWEAYQSISKRRNENMQLMMATRKDKKDKQDDKEKPMDIIAQVISDPDFEKVEQKPKNIRDTKLPT